jgi:hypothetical protein
MVRVGGNRVPWMGWLLLVLLAFTTATVFVREAWALEAFQIGIYSLLAGYLMATWRGSPGNGMSRFAPLLVYCIPFWGMLQLAVGATTCAADTLRAVLRWGALAAVFYLAQIAMKGRAARRVLTDVLLCFATALAVLCMVQLFTSEGRVLWTFPTGYDDVYGTFQSHNNYAQFVELALPIALWRALSDRRRSFWYAFAGGVLYASAIGSASRAGAFLCTVELLAMLGIGLVRFRDPETGRPSRATSTMLLVVPALAIAFTLVVGWERVWLRFQQKDPYSGRREFAIAALKMAEHRPFTGFGLDTFPSVYQSYAVKDFSFYANHAHNDWAEFAADGGVPFLLLVLIPFTLSIPAALRHPWALGLIAVMLHACVDYPFPRPAVSGWMYLLLGAVYASEARKTVLRCGTEITEKNGNSVEETAILP